MIDPRRVVKMVPRSWRVLRILRRHGVLRAVRGRGHWPQPAAVRAALEELGVVYLKFGQVLALRRDLLPDAYVEELEKLHDALPPMPFAAVRETIEQALGGTLESHFPSFDRTPLAAATIAQVHVAALADGSNVVVKVRRPGLDRLIVDDTAMLAQLAAAVEAWSSRLQALGLVDMVEEFRANLLRETDLLLEAQAIRRFRAALADAPGVWIPNVVMEHTAPPVLTMEHSPGERIDRYAKAHQHEARSLADRLTALVLHQVFETGLFHADPHPGNVFVLPDGRLCLHDFGAIGELEPRVVSSLADALQAFVEGDARGLTDAYLGLGWAGHDVDRTALEHDLSGLVAGVHGHPLHEVSIGRVLESLMRTGSQHQVRNPGELILLARAFLITEALMHELDPTLSVVEAFRGELGRITARRYAPARLLERARHNLRDLERLTRDLPERLDRVLQRIADGNLGRVQLPALEAAGQRASRDLERLTGALASAALVVAGALLVGAGGWHRVVGDVMLLAGVAGTLTAALGAWWQKRK